MPESLQQKVDRMTAGMEITVTFGGSEPGTCTGPLNQPYAGLSLTMVWLEDDAGIRGLSDPDELTLVPPEPAPFKPGDKVRWNANTRADNDDRENRKTVARCEKVGGYWRVYYVRDADERYDRWDFADGLELAPEPAEPDCPAVLVTYTDGPTYAVARDRTRYGQLTLAEWLTHPNVATVQALRPAEYLRGGR